MIKVIKLCLKAILRVIYRYMYLHTYMNTMKTFNKYSYLKSNYEQYYDHKKF